ncbi:MAG: fatty acid desaturase, partial [bacterium]
AVSFAVALAWTDAAGAATFAAGVVAWGVFLRTVIVWHITWSVNSLTHIFGYRNHATDENSRNNWLVALFACGEGWHNNHHSDPACCTVRHRWWEIDVTYLEVRALSLVGLAWDIVPRRETRTARAREAVAAKLAASMSVADEGERATRSAADAQAESGRPPEAASSAAGR